MNKEKHESVTLTLKVTPTKNMQECLSKSYLIVINGNFMLNCLPA